MKPFFGGARSRQKNNNNNLFCSYFLQEHEARRHGLFVLSGSFLGAYCHQSGLWGADAQGLLPSCLEGSPCPDAALRAETIAGGPAQIPRPGLGHRKEAFSGKGKRLPDHSLGFERPKLV